MSVCLCERIGLVAQPPFTLHEFQFSSRAVNTPLDVSLTVACVDHVTPSAPSSLVYSTSRGPSATAELLVKHTCQWPVCLSVCHIAYYNFLINILLSSHVTS